MRDRDVWFREFRKTAANCQGAVDRLQRSVVLSQPLVKARQSKVGVDEKRVRLDLFRVNCHGLRSLPQPFEQQAVVVLDCVKDGLLPVKRIDFGTVSDIIAVVFLRRRLRGLRTV